MKHFNRERGQSLVELAISMVVLLYLLCGAVEFGLAFFQFVQLRDAAQEGALYGSMNPSADIQTRVRGASSSPINLADATITVSAKDPLTGSTLPVAGACEGDALTVQVSYNHQVFMPFMSRIIGPQIPLNAVVTDTVLSPPQTDPICS